MSILKTVLVVGGAVSLAFFVHVLIYNFLPTNWVLAHADDYSAIQSELAHMPEEAFDELWAQRGPRKSVPWVKSSLKPEHPVRQLYEYVPTGNHVQLWLLRYDPLSRFAMFPLTILDTVGQYDVKLVSAPPNRPGPSERFVYPNFAERTPASYLVNALTALVFALGFCRLIALGYKHQAVLVIAFGIIACNWAFHTIWGDTQLFLYSQHWVTATFIVLAGAFAGHPKQAYQRFRLGSVAVWLLILNNLVWLTKVLSEIQAT